MAIKHIQVRIDEDVLDWFDQKFPMHGAKQWFVAACFEKLQRMMSREHTMSPADMIDHAVQEVAEDL